MRIFIDFTGVFIVLFLLACILVLGVVTLITGIAWWYCRRFGCGADRNWKGHFFGSLASFVLAGHGYAAFLVGDSWHWHRYGSTIRWIENNGLFLLWLVPLAAVWWRVARAFR